MVDYLAAAPAGLQSTLVRSFALTDFALAAPVMTRSYQAATQLAFNQAAPATQYQVFPRSVLVPNVTQGVT